MAIILNNALQHPMVTTVMIIDDQTTSRIILETIVQSIGDNINIRSFDNAHDALQTAEVEPPDLILADYKMPALDGVEFTRRIRMTPTCIDIPIIIVTIVDDKALMYEALEAGATDFLIKPVDHYECKVRCRNLLTMRRQQLIIRNRASSLESMINKAVKQIQIREKETLYRLARAGEFKDQITGQHLVRIGKISRIIAIAIGLGEKRADNIEFSAPMHDIGKIGIPDNILLKEGILKQEEFEVMKTHTTIGHEILKDSPSPYLQTGAIIALNHHEHFDGRGYPAGLAGEEIPIEARIVAVADVFDALISKRAYKDAWSVENAITYFKEQKSGHLDPACVKVLLSNKAEIVECLEKKISNTQTN
ncbi:MAG: HD domain-containing phosphohydrolase [Gammaproteobacteria bacterium]